MTAATMLCRARRSAGLTQASLALRGRTSQATISAYESGAKVPSVETLSRLLAAAGSRLALESAAAPVVQRSKDDLEENGRRLAEVLELAEALPGRRRGTLDFPALALLEQ